jgi:hypothetical protein
MHLFDGKEGILRPNNGLVFKLMPKSAVFYLGPTPQAHFLGSAPAAIWQS